MLMSLILSIIPKLSVSWQVSLNKCTLQLDPAKRINSMSLAEWPIFFLKLILAYVALVLHGWGCLCIEY